MTQCDLDKTSSGAAAGRADVIAPIEGLVKEVAHLAIRIKHLVAMANAAKAELAEQAVGPGATRPVTETVEQTVLKATSAATACDPQALEMAEAVMFPLSPEQDCMDKASSGEANLIDELTSKQESIFPEPKNASCREESAVAARVAELHERLGGFITPSLPRPPHQTS
jgi:hypothetical protein